MTVTKTNFKSPHIYILYTLFVLLGIGLLVYYFSTHDEDYLYISMGIFLFIGVLFSIGFLTKITIDRNGIRSSSLIKDHLLHWRDIKTVGVYRINRYGIKIVAPEHYDKFSFFGQRFIYVSKEPNFLPKRNQMPSSDFIQFHWRKSAWTEIDKYFSKKVNTL